MWKDELTLKGGKEDPYTIRCVVVPKVSKCENCPATFDKVSNLKVHITNKHCRSSATSVRKRCSVNVTWKNTFRHSQRAHEFSKNCQRLHCILPLKWAPNWLALHSLWFIGYKLFKTYQAHDKTQPHVISAIMRSTFISKSFYWKPMYYKEYSTFSNGTFECVCSFSLCWLGYDGTSYMGFPPICLRSGTLPPSDCPCNFLIAAVLRVSPDGFPRRWTSLFCWGFLFPRC